MAAKIQTAFFWLMLLAWAGSMTILFRTLAKA